jgi:hypothetical protein
LIAQAGTGDLISRQGKVVADLLQSVVRPDHADQITWFREVGVNPFFARQAVQTPRVSQQIIEEHLAGATGDPHDAGRRTATGRMRYLGALGIGEGQQPVDLSGQRGKAAELAVLPTVPVEAGQRQGLMQTADNDDIARFQLQIRALIKRGQRPARLDVRIQHGRHATTGRVLMSSNADPVRQPEDHSADQ